MRASEQNNNNDDDDGGDDGNVIRERSRWNEGVFVWFNDHY